MVEYWNVGLNKEVAHSLASLSSGIFANPSPCPRQVHPLFHFPITHYSIIPIFQYSNCERSELSSIILRQNQLLIWRELLLYQIKESLHPPG